MTSQETVASARYSASAVDRETVCCFFDFHDTRYLPRKTQETITERRVSEHDR